MPGFCKNCGAPVAGAFCGKCGQSAQTPSAPAQPPNVPAQAPRAATQAPGAPVQPQTSGAPAEAGKKSSGCGKALLIVGAIVVVFVGLGIAGAFYGAHWLKQKVSTATGGALGGSQEQVKVVTSGNSCALLSKEDLQQDLGITIEKSQEIMEGSEPGCAYYTNAEAFAQLQKMAVEQAKKDSEEASKKMPQKVDNPAELLKHTKEMEGMIKALALTQPDKEGRVFSFTIQRNFDSSGWYPVRATLSVVPGFEDVEGVGDRAMIGSFGHALYVLKGNNLIHLDMTYVPNARTRGADIARMIAARL